MNRQKDKKKIITQNDSTIKLTKYMISDNGKDISFREDRYSWGSNTEQKNIHCSAIVVELFQSCLLYYHTLIIIL